MQANPLRLKKLDFNTEEPVYFQNRVNLVSTEESGKNFCNELLHSGSQLKG